MEVFSSSHTGAIYGSLIYRNENYAVRLLSQGLAYTINNINHENFCEDEELILLEQEAKESRVGIWARENPIFEENFFSKSKIWELKKIYSVKISAIVNEKSIFVHLLDNSKDLERVVEDIQDLALSKSLQKLEASKIESGTLCLAMFSDDLEWYRAKVTSIKKIPETNEVQYNVFFIDYGNSETVEYSSLAIMPANMLEIKPLAIRTSLAGITLPRKNHEMY